VMLVDSVPGMEAYFAEEVQDLNALDSNILAKLHDCEGFITVMHPRGEISRPNGTVLTRASVWIEQEIAIATYIRQIEKRTLRVIAFKHRSVALEGIRSLIQLNPVEFKDETEIMAKLPELLDAWKNLAPSGIRPEIKSTRTIKQQDGHAIRQLIFTLVNDSSSRIREISGEYRVPAGILKHWSGTYAREDNQAQHGRSRVFRFDEKNVGVIGPRSTCDIDKLEYCVECAAADTGEPLKLLGRIAVDEYLVEITVWIEGREYHAEKTMKQLSMETGEN